MAETGHTGGRIVVGVDGSMSSEPTLRWALEHARLTGATLVVIYAWEVPASLGVPMAFDTGEDLARAAERLLEDAVAKASGGDPRVPVERRVSQGHPATVLLDAAADADLLVVGSHGRGGFVRALLGSVSQHCINHASCPVVVVRGAGRPRRG
jgi:nucleotide-binding universal stress UspA family protein